MQNGGNWNTVCATHIHGAVGNKETIVLLLRQLDF